MKVWDSILMKAGKGLSIQQSDDTRKLFALCPQFISNKIVLYKGKK